MNRLIALNFGMLPIPNSIRMAKRRLLRRREGELILRERFSKLHGNKLDLYNPKTFTEKLYRRMVDINRSGSPEFTRLADKYLARDHVKKVLGTQFLTKLLWTGFDPGQIPFDDLPARSIVKTNHGSGSNLRLEQSVDRKAVARTLTRWMSENYYWAFREYQYYEIEPRLMVEEFLDDGNHDGPIDYRVWCFNGIPEAIQLDNHSHSMNAFYTPSWDLMGLTYRSEGGNQRGEPPE